MTKAGFGTAPDENSGQNLSARQSKKSKSWGKTLLRGAFNMAAGAAVSAVAKSCALGLLATCSAPAIATVLVPAAAAGIGLSLWKMCRDYKAAKDAGEKEPTFWDTKSFLFTMATSMAGGAIVGFYGDEIKEGATNLYNSLFGVEGSETNPTVYRGTIDRTYPYNSVPVTMGDTISPDAIEPSAGDDMDTASEDLQEAPEPYVPTDTLEKAVAFLKDDADTPSKILDRIYPAMAGDAQAQKDIAHYLFNECDPEDGQRHTAALLAKESADAGNTQAKEFWNFIRYWGLADIDANKQEALAAMREIDTKSAQHLAAQWGGDIPMEQVEAKPDCDKPAAVVVTTSASFNQTSTPAVSDNPNPATEKTLPETASPANNALPEQGNNGCTSIIDLETNQISHICHVSDNVNVRAGDTVRIENPPIIPADMLLQDDKSRALFSMPPP